MKIVHQKKKCIGCGACVNACPRLFQMEADRKAGLTRGNKGKERETLVLSEPGCAKEAAAVCPVRCIHIRGEEGDKK